VPNVQLQWSIKGRRRDAETQDYSNERRR